MSTLSWSVWVQDRVADLLNLLEPRLPSSPRPTHNCAKAGTYDAERYYPDADLPEALRPS